MICKDNQVTVACEKFARFSLTIALNHSIPAFEHRQVEQYFQQKVPVGIRARRKKRNLAWLNLRWRIKTLLKCARRRLREKLRIHDIVGSVVILRPFRPAQRLLPLRLFRPALAESSRTSRRR